ncbi:odorant receptor 131-2-like [Gambusia affinis]|uniref:odorant receptor 131-2-like n=1 Tax=Gambusia affinis TaxID=33528 RepID=UPI001CDCB625|nr:odorant receptor 131-2-like [Gambusia affinis]
MNLSAANVTVVVQYGDSFSKALIKNLIVVVLWIFINYMNAGLTYTFSKHQVFNTNPRYILFVHLVINDMIQVTLTVALFITSYIFFMIPMTVCCFFILIAIFTTENTPLNLACMAVECYIAICIPLRHAQICTVKKTRLLIFLIWATSLVSVLPDLFMTLATQSEDYFKLRVFCIRERVFPNPRITERRNITYIVYLVLVWCIIFFIYFRIMFTARTASKDAKKARNTILLHGFQLLLCMATYAEPLVKDMVWQQFRDYYLDALFACYLLFQIIPRFISSIIYGVRDKTFRKHLKGYLLYKINRQ